MSHRDGRAVIPKANLRRVAFMSSAALACMAIGAVAWGTGAPLRAAPGSPDRGVQRLPTPERINAETRAEVRARMSRHGNTMSSLVRAVVLLDRPAIRNLAGRIADEEIIAAPDAANRSGFWLPDEFYTQQSKLSVVAQNMAIAAREGRDDLVMADHFSGLARTCVACHVAYVRGGPFPPAVPPKTVPGPRR